MSVNLNNNAAWPDWMHTLDHESKPPIDSLLHIHDELSSSRDSFMKYAAGWAALYASQKQQPQADEAYAMAIDTFRQVADEPVVDLYQRADEATGFRADFALRMALRIRHPHHVLTPDERKATYHSLGGLLSNVGAEAIAGSDKAMGLLSEVAITAVEWRPNPAALSVFNVVPAGPTKDGRGSLRRLATDLYAYHPTIVSTRKGRVNAQVKTNVDPRDRKKYDTNIVALIGLNEVVYHDEQEELTGREACYLLADTLMRDMSVNTELAPDQKDTLCFTMSAVHDRILEVAESKTKYVEKQRRKRDTGRSATLSNG